MRNAPRPFTNPRTVTHRVRVALQVREMSIKVLAYGLGIGECTLRTMLRDAAPYSLSPHLDKMCEILRVDREWLVRPEAPEFAEGGNVR